MDHYGIGVAIKGAAEIYLRSARGTGRTTSLLESLKDGDRVVCRNAKEANLLRRRCKERKLDVECVVVDVNGYNLFSEVLKLGTGQGRTLFDHTWVEDYYVRAIESCAKDIDRLQQDLSGFGEPHLETRRRAAEIAKWSF